MNSVNKPGNLCPPKDFYKVSMRRQMIVEGNQIKALSLKVGVFKDKLALKNACCDH